MPRSWPHVRLESALEEAPIESASGIFSSGVEVACEELELVLIQAHLTQKPLRRVEVGACRFAQQTNTAKKP